LPSAEKIRMQVSAIVSRSTAREERFPPFEQLKVSTFYFSHISERVSQPRAIPDGSSYLEIF